MIYVWNLRDLIREVTMLRWTVNSNNDHLNDAQCIV